MTGRIRPELSEKNKYHMDKHRYYELKHFCLQYPLWKKAYEDINEIKIATSVINTIPSSNVYSDLTAKYAMMKNFYSEKIEVVENAAKDSDPVLGRFILKAVTEGLSYTVLKSRLEIPCGRDYYYERYRRFFWLLDQARG